MKEQNQRQKLTKKWTIKTLKSVNKICYKQDLTSRSC